MRNACRYFSPREHGRLHQVTRDGIALNRIPRRTSALLFLLLAHASEAGTITGTLRVPPVSAGMSANPYPGRASALPGRHDVPHGRVTDAVVYVDKLSARTDSLISGRPILGGRVAYQDARVSPNGRFVAYTSNSSSTCSLPHLT